MPAQRSVMPAALAIGLGLQLFHPAPTALAGDLPKNPEQQFAFSLDEMNCFSSDIRLRQSGAAIATEDGASGLLLAGESGGGSNGIPCNARDPKAPPKHRSRT